MAYNFDSITILIIEENEAVVSLLSYILRTFQVGNIVTAKDGEQGFRKVVGFNPDIILSEIVLAKLNGPVMIRKIRKDRSSPNPYVPIIALTAYNELSYVKEARDAGVNDILVKPFTARDLYSRLVHVIENPRQFVISENFNGPDRRRRRGGGYSYQGPDRRAGSGSEKVAGEVTQESRNTGALPVFTQSHKKNKVEREPVFIKNYKYPGSKDYDIDLDLVIDTDDL